MRALNFALAVLSLTVVPKLEASPSQNGIRTSLHPILLVVSFDGFRYDYLNKTNTPALDLLRTNGVYAPYMRPVFPTYTFPNHQTIVTGLYAASHGIVDNTVYDALYKRTLSVSDEGFWNYNKLVKPVWILNEEAGGGRVSGALMWPGSDQGYGEHNNLLPTFYQHYNGSMPWEERVQIVISWMTHEQHPANLIFLYYNEPDSRGHAIGPNDPQMIEEIRRCDDRTQHLVDSLKAANLFDHVSLILTSDHGMEVVPMSHTIGMQGIVDPVDILRQSGAVVGQIGPKEGKFNQVYDAFVEAAKVRNFSVHLKHEFTEFNYDNDRRVMDIILLADPGYRFDFERSFHDGMIESVPGEKAIGVHGYDHRHPAMRPYFVAYGPLFKKGITIDPFDNVDLFSLFCKVAGIPPAPHNGTFGNVKSMLVSDTESN